MRGRTIALISLLALGCRSERSRPLATSATAPVSPAPTPISDDDRASFFVPEGDARGLPFVLVLHGLGGSGAEIAEALALTELARQKRFVFAAPSGGYDAEGRRFWNAGPSCCDFHGSGVDDVKRLFGLVDWATQSLHADPARVFVVGYSNGGFMAHRLACAAPQRLRAIVSLAASGPSAEACAGTSPLALLEMHGDVDPIVPYAGGHLFGQASYPLVNSVQTGLKPWLQRAGCSERAAPSESLDLDPRINGAETEIQRREGCSRPIELWTVHGAGHRLPLGPAALEAVWRFLSTS
ncbi:MAG: alpha/beta fold hydrolase [Polyangiaceae bacterium]